MRFTTFLSIQYIFSPVFVVLKSCSLFFGLQTLFIAVEGKKYLRQALQYDGSTDDIILPPYLSYETSGPILDERTPNSRVPNRIVWLSGPHKTASSSVQANIMVWTSEEDYILKNWAWPEPSLYRGENSRNHPPEVLHNKAFAQVTFAESKGSNRDSIGSVLLRQDYKIDRDVIIETFRREFAKAWLMGYDLIIASEFMDYFDYDCGLPGLDGPNDNGDVWLDNFMDLMPWRNPVQVETNTEAESFKEVSLVNLEGNDDMITVVVKYRAPRVDHLISTWHQCCMMTMKFTPFLVEYMKNPTSNNSPVREIDSLGLVQRYLDHGLNVVLIDMSGATSHGLDVSDIIACEVLGNSERCAEYKQDDGDSDEGAIVINAKSPEDESDFDISEYQVELLEFAIQNYDCLFEDMIKKNNPKLTLLYPEDLLKNIDDCKNIPEEDRLKSKDELVDEIVRIGLMVNEEEAKDEEEDF